MKIGLIHVGWLQTNCYLISDDSGRCAVVDPGGDAERILQALKEQELRCEAILLTTVTTIIPARWRKSGRRPARRSISAPETRTVWMFPRT